MQSSNPAFNSAAFGRPGGYADAYGQSASTTMTVQGTGLKTFGLLAILLTTAAWSWGQVSNPGMIRGLMMVGGIGGLIAAIATIARPAWSPFTAPLYAALEGVALGALSSLIDHGLGRPAYHGLPQQAVALTCGTLFVMLVIYTTGLIKVTPRLTAGIVAATGAIALLYLVSMVLSLFHVAMPIINSATPLGIGFSVFVVGLAAFNLLLDFDFIEKGARAGLPKYMEWYGAFGLMVTLVWLYLEILRLLRKLQDRRD